MRNTNVKSLLCIFILLLQGLCSSLLAYTLDYNAGNLINTGVRGTNPHRYDPDRTGVLGVSYNTSLRSLPSGGLCADTYDWRDNNTGWYESGKTTNTLQVLRELRDHNSWGVFTANARGICDSSGVYNYNVNLPQLAADWVRYINRIVRLYRWNGSSVTDINGNPVTITGEDLRVCNSILWCHRPGYTAPVMVGWSAPVAVGRCAPPMVARCEPPAVG